MSYSYDDEVKRALEGIVTLKRPNKPIQLDEYYKLLPVDESMRRSRENLISEGFTAKRKSYRQAEARKWGLITDDD